MYDYEEHYYEPSIADEIMVEYQQKMKDALLKTVKNDIEGVKQENERLKEENEKLKEKVNGIAQRERELECKKDNLVREVRSKRLSELMKDFEIAMYRVDDESIKIPKCNKCNNSRKIEFISPLGKKMEEYCTCNVSETVYVVKEFLCVEFRVDRDRKQMLMWYKVKQDRDRDYDHCKILNTDAEVYEEGIKFEDLDTEYHNLFFKSKEQCQKYCDWLNSKEVL